MAVSSLRFRMEADNSSVLGAMRGVNSAAQGLGRDLQRNIGDKLSGVFSVAVIEQVIQRTGEWAVELSKSARALNIGTSELQALRIMADRAGVSTDKLFNFYNKIEAAAQKAANGNKKLKESFSALGISSSELKGPNKLETVALGQRVLQGARTAPGALPGLGLGKSILDVQALAKETRGRSPEEMQQAYKGEIVSETDVAVTSKAWHQIGDDLKALGVTLAPLVSGVLLIVDGVFKMVTGIVGTITGVIGDISAMIGHLSAGDFKSAGKMLAKSTAGRLTSMGAGIAKMATFGLANKQIDAWIGGSQEQLFGAGSGLSDEEKRLAEGAGEGVATVATFGTAPIMKAAGMGMKGAEAAAGFAGAGKLASGIGKAGSRIGAGSEGVVGSLSSALFRRFRNAKFKAGTKGGISKADKELMEELGLSESEFVSLRGTDSRAFEQMLSGKINSLPAVERAALLAKYSGVGGVAGLSGAAGSEDVAGSDFLSGGVGKSPDRGGVFSLGSGAGMGGGGSGNLAIGGVMGVDIQSRIASLNEKMVDLLQQIVTNTDPNNYQADEDQTGA